MINDSSNQNISYLVSRYIPQFILDEYPNFRLFIETYYEYCQQNGFVPYNVIRNIENWNDIDTTIDEFVDYFKKEYIELPDIDNWDYYLKHYKDIYRSKGSTKSLQLLLNLLSSGATDIEYPNRVLMKSSDGVYRQYKIIYCEVNPNINYDDYISTKVTGIISGATGIVENIEIYDYYIKVYLSHTEGNFKNEEVQFTNGKTFNAALDYIVDKLNIIDAGNGYNVGDEVSIDGNDEFKAKISSVTTGKLDDITVTNAGTGYKVGETLIFSCDKHAEYYSLPFVKITKIKENGEIDNIKILYKGYGLLDVPVVTGVNTEEGEGATFELVSKGAGAIKSIDISSTTSDADESSTISIESDGHDAILECNINYEFYETPYYYKKGSFLSDIFKLQDSYYYQEYSYVLNISSTLLNKYKELFKSIHPAGFAYFTNTILENMIYLRPYYYDSTLNSVYDEELYTKFIDSDIELLHYSDRVKYSNILFDMKNKVIDNIKDRVLLTFNKSGGTFVNSTLEVGTDIEMVTITIDPTPADATVVLSSTGYTQVGNMIIVPVGASVSYIVSKQGYTTVTNTITADRSMTIEVELNELSVTATLTINPTPSDATVILTATGYLQVDNSITVEVGTPVTYTVLKENYISQTDTITINNDTTLNIVLSTRPDYEYNVLTGNNVELTKYVGINSNITTPKTIG